MLDIEAVLEFNHEGLGDTFFGGNLQGRVLRCCHQTDKDAFLLSFLISFLQKGNG